MATMVAADFTGAGQPFTVVVDTHTVADSGAACHFAVAKDSVADLRSEVAAALTEADSTALAAPAAAVVSTAEADRTAAGTGNPAT
jgi:hypothetical protein